MVNIVNITLLKIPQGRDGDFGTSSEQKEEDTPEGPTGQKSGVGWEREVQGQDMPKWLAMDQLRDLATSLDRAHHQASLIPQNRTTQGHQSLAEEGNPQLPK